MGKIIWQLMDALSRNHSDFNAPQTASLDVNIVDREDIKDITENEIRKASSVPNFDKLDIF